MHQSKSETEGLHLFFFLLFLFFLLLFGVRNEVKC
jgi:hypothetical protein